jgi:hypothetical protein
MIGILRGLAFVTGREDGGTCLVERVTLMLP